MREERASRGRSRAVALTIAGLLAPGSGFEGALASPRATNFERLRQRVAERGIDPEVALQPLEITGEMASWARARVPAAGGEGARLRFLLDALRYGNERNFTYQVGHTGTARDVFEQGLFNCVSFSLLFVGLARELDLPAYFLNVEGSRHYTRSGDLVIETRGHLTAGYGRPGERTILEFGLANVDYRSARPISDLDGLALFFSNRGAEALREDDVDLAIEHLERAVRLDEELVQAWVNLGVARRRSGDHYGAEQAYRRAFRESPGDLTVLENLYVLRSSSGESDAAQEILALLEKSKHRNPYTYLELGDRHLAEGRTEAARSYYQRAFKLARGEAETHAAMGLWALAAGRVDRARRWLESARRLAPANPRVIRLAEDLGSAP